ncbi:MAG: peptidase M48 Ste24p [Desulfobulbaceae bacterium]|nr:MAG: peptidase M48 Ste24p [Desulfobulbaceae bacterium]
MIEIYGKYFDGQTSAHQSGLLVIHENSSWVLKNTQSLAIIKQGKSFQAKVSPRLADTPRAISFSGLDHFETEQNDQVDAALARLKKRHWSGPIHLLESKFRYVLIALILFVVGAFGFVRYGIPTTASVIAMNLPQDLLEVAGSQTMSALDRILLKSSKLDPQKKDEVLDHFERTINHYPELNLDVIFRDGGKIGANAFALPDGRIVFTDQLINLATDQDQLLAILIHEIGHIYHRHGLKRLIQNSILTFGIYSLTGDASGVSELFLGLPVILTELGYSRKFETEADTFTLEQMNRLGLEPYHFADILLKIEYQEIAAKKDAEAAEQAMDGWLGYLSTHPATKDRIKRFQRIRKKLQ